ncbi:uncharacterized protein BJ212DRAFT_1486281 [Suillus subaureus]|uniref:Uncharacterized protein n=1 Tax=Suillus subaureus TaxID=48587 RepID=A0A9P7J6Y2_9AGAM|nr:uncharacterized protein BJ212DRAFT_1486281 [Suillus subaureus]KAG1805726.1 hypothetical protein BJ212DRAFT_1486281 [Suillus subaureus]
MSKVDAEHIAYAAVQARFGISSLDKWNDKDGYFHYSDFYTRITRLIHNRNFGGEWVDSLLAHYNEILFGNENGAKPSHSENIDCSDDDDMIAMERQLAARASRASRSTDPAPTQSSVPQQKPRQDPLPPPPQRPTPDSPIALAPVNSRNDAQRAVSPLPPSSPQESVSNTPVISRKRKIVSAPVDDLFNDDSPLTEEEEPEVIQPARRGRKGWEGSQG